MYPGYSKVSVFNNKSFVCNDIVYNTHDSLDYVGVVSDTYIVNRLVLDIRYVDNLPYKATYILLVSISPLALLDNFPMYMTGEDHRRSVINNFIQYIKAS
jgi:hypothetical protein